MRARRMVVPSLRSFASSGAIVLLVTILLSPAAAWAQGIKLDDPDLARISDAILTGRVISIAYGRDPQVPYMYTYVSIEIDEHIKGLGMGTELVVKQLGGQIGDLAMVVYDQATFTVGEEVLLFLVERPRDGTLQTTGLWQGKWTINRDPVSGDGEATRAAFGTSDQADFANASEFEDSRLLAPFVAELRNWIGPQDGSVAPMRRFNTQPAEAAAAIVDPTPAFGLFDVRWNQADSSTPVSVDILASGQPNLAGGGFAEIGVARGLWNSAGSRLTLVAGNNVLSGASTTAICSDTTNPFSGRITIYFGDPCDELADDGTIAVGGTFSTANGGVTVNGTAFNRIIAGFVINNDGTQSFLTNSSCFQDIETHEIGHSIGIDHTSIPGNIMNPTAAPACFAAVSVQADSSNEAPITGGLGSDDIAAINFIYPAPAPPPGGPDQVPGPPRGLTYTLVADRVILDWLPPATGGPVNSYQVQGGVGPGKLNFVNFDTFQNATKINLKIGEGEYYIRVRARNSNGLSLDPSNEVTFVITGTPSVPNPVFVPPTLNAAVDTFGNIVVMGEVQNKVVGAGPPTFIRVEATFFSPDGSIVGTGFTFVLGRSRRLRASGIVTDTALLAGQRGCFMMSTNVPASQVDSYSLEGSYGTSVNDQLQGRLRLGEYTQQEDSFGKVQMVGNASNIGSRATYFNKIVFDVKTPKIQTCDFTFVQGSTVGLPGGGTTSTGLSPGEAGTFSNSTNVPFGPIEVRLYTTWDETAPAGAGGTLDALRKTDAEAAAVLARLEAHRSVLRQLISGPGKPSRGSLHDLRNRIEGLVQELEERMAPAGASSRVRFSERLLLPVRLALESRATYSSMGHRAGAAASR